MIRCQQYENNVYKEIDVDNQLMQEIATYIYEHYDKKITLDDMAERFHISRSYLSKKFKQATGFGFKEYLVNVRIKMHAVCYLKRIILLRILHLSAVLTTAIISGMRSAELRA